MHKKQHSTFSILRSAFCIRGGSRRSSRATAAVETAIILPLYMIILFGLVYLGYATLSTQRQALAAAYSAWLGHEQAPEDLLAEFWPWAGDPAAGSGAGEATAGDTSVTVGDETRLDDPYYGTLIESQLVAGIHSLGGSGEDTFDRERIAASLWTLALGEVNQYFEWVPDEGIVERISTHYDQFAHYLNAAFPTGFIDASDESPPAIGNYENWIAEALNGLGDGHWLERRQTTADATYRPPFFKTVYREPGAERTGFADYISGDYPEPEHEPTVAMTFDLTGRGDAVRHAVGEGNVGPDDLVAQIGDFLGRDALPAPDEMDSLSIGTGTLRDLWTPQ